MSNKAQDRSADKEKERQEGNSPDEGGLYPVEELVNRGGYLGNPEEIVQLPGVAPRMYSTEKELRGDLRREE